MIQVGKGPEQREELLNHFQNNFLEELFVAVLLSIAAGALLSRQALRPVQRFTKALGPIIDTGQVKARVSILSSGDEFERHGLSPAQVLSMMGPSALVNLCTGCSA